MSLKEEERKDRKTQREEAQVTMEAEIRGVQLQATEHQKLLAVTKS